MNPILQDVLAFLYDRRQFTGFRQEKTGENRRKVEFAFTNGTSETREYECDLATFMAWWKEAEGYLQETAEAFRRAGERL